MAKKAAGPTKKATSKAKKTGRRALEIAKKAATVAGRAARKTAKKVRTTVREMTGPRGIQPILFVPDVDKAVEYYAATYGAKVGMKVPGPGGAAIHALVTFGENGIQFHADSPEGMADTEAKRWLATKERGHGVQLYLYVKDVAAIYAQAKTAGADVWEEIQDQFWGDRLFTVRDNNGYVLTFAQKLKEWDGTVPSGPTRA
ncbi:MAG: VOC family protein [Methanobacteriota archaeon]